MKSNDNKDFWPNYTHLLDIVSDQRLFINKFSFNLGDSSLALGMTHVFSKMGGGRSGDSSTNEWKFLISLRIAASSTSKSHQMIVIPSFSEGSPSFINPGFPKRH